MGASVPISNSGAGGGSLFLNISSSLVLNGQILVDGSNGGCVNGLISLQIYCLMCFLSQEEEELEALSSFHLLHFLGAILLSFLQMEELVPTVDMVQFCVSCNITIKLQNLFKFESEKYNK